MQFHLEFTPKTFSQKIIHRHKLMLMGSCFTENMSDKLVAHKFEVLTNPNGILFNPVSVKAALDSYISNKKIDEDNLFYLNESYHSWNHHSRFSGITAKQAVEKINNSTEQAHTYLKQADWLIITLGSAWVYELTNNASNTTASFVAANNHKAPANWFAKRLLNPVELNTILEDMIVALKAFNSNLQIIFTISPVRHIREGFVENNRSKASLITSVHQSIEKNKHCFYFPAYELVIDDLRDYRFYAEDMVHPNYAATNYVWEKFVTTSIDDDTQLLMKEINEINAALKHKPFNAETETHKNFKAKYLNKVKQLMHQFPYVDFTEERKYFEE